MDGADVRGVWQTLQPDWPMLLLGGTILLLILVLVAFLVAAVLLRRHNERKARTWSGYERKWGAMLTAVEGGWARNEAVKTGVAAGEELEFVDFLYKQALRTSDPERRALLGQLAAPYLSRIAERTTGGDAERRARAVKTLSELGGAAHVGSVIAALDDPSPLVSMSAARALAAAGGEERVRAIVSRVGRFGDWNSRFLRATLTQLGSAAAPALRESVADASLPARIRAVCLEVLGDLADAEAAALAADVLQGDEDVDLWAAALRVIRRHGEAEHVFMVQPLCAHGDPVIRAQAVGTLAHLADDDGLDLLEGALRDPSPWVTLHAARGLKHRGRLAVLERLSTGDDDAAANAAVALQVLREEA